MHAINRWLLEHDLRLDVNPAISPDWCLDWPGLQAALRSGAACVLEPSRIALGQGCLCLAEGPRGNRA